MIALKAWHPERLRTPRELLSRLGRCVLWLAVTVVLLRGLAGILDSAPRAVGPGRAHAAAPTWPDDAARAYAIEFATAYLTIAPDDPGTRTAAAELAAGAIANTLTPTLDGESAAQQVESATVAGVTRLESRRALITVAARVRGARARTIRLTVPVAHDASGALVVSDLPSLAPPESRAAAGPVAGAPIVGAERDGIGDVLTRFLRAYLSGDRAGLAYLVPAGTRIAASAGGFELREIGSITGIGREAGRERLVLATVHVRDQASRATYALRYRVRLVRGDRWYVAAINDSPGGGTR
jgi:hypothetical protein